MPISILAVDDERNLLELLITVLGKKGFKVKTALNGLEALKLLDQESFQLALLDLKMGPLNGVQLLKQIKDRQPVIKVIMMTAYPTSDTRMEASANGASAYHQTGRPSKTRRHNKFPGTLTQFFLVEVIVTADFPVVSSSIA